MTLPEIKAALLAPTPGIIFLDEIDFREDEAWERHKDADNEYEKTRDRKRQL